MKRTLFLAFMGVIATTVASASFSPTFIVSGTGNSVVTNGSYVTQTNNASGGATATASISGSIHVGGAYASARATVSQAPYVTLSVTDPGSYSSNSFDVLVKIKISRSATASVTIQNPMRQGGVHAASKALNAFGVGRTLTPTIEDNVSVDYNGGNPSVSIGPADSVQQVVVTVSKVTVNNVASYQGLVDLGARRIPSLVTITSATGTAGTTVDSNASASFTMSVLSCTPL